MISTELDTDAKFAQEPPRRDDVIHHRQIFQDDIAGREQRSGHGGKCGVFGPADPNLSPELGTASDF